MSVAPPRRSIVGWLTAAALLGAVPRLATPLRAQAGAESQPQRAFVLQAGQWYTDVEGVVASARAELPLDRGGRWLFVPAVTYAHYTLSSPVPHMDLFAPEALVHFQLGQGRVRPYVGGGAGVVLINMFHTFDPVVSVGTGLRADLTPTLGARLELDARGFGQVKAGAVGWSLGIAQRF